MEENGVLEMQADHIFIYALSRDGGSHLCLSLKMAALKHADTIACIQGL